MDAYFEQIRHDQARLTAFFSAMPKGGDLHNHFSGSIYAETYWHWAVARKYYIDTVTLEIRPRLKKDLPRKEARRFTPLASLLNKRSLPALRQRLMQEWSIKDYTPAYAPSDKHFFDAFGKFPDIKTAAEIGEGLVELRNRARAENVQYLEIMLKPVPLNKDTLSPRPVSFFKNDVDTALNSRWRALQKSLPASALDTALQKAYARLKPGAQAAARAFVRTLRQIHDAYVPDDSATVIRYLTFVKREDNPVAVFKSLTAGFEAVADNSDSLATGINLVSREDGPYAMGDYNLHMSMVRFLHRQYPQVKISLHAGELTLGLVRPEHLTFHIHEAVLTAGADRIGHGVDIAFEKNLPKLMDHMSKNKIPVEINLWSNDFILNVRGDQHPIGLYLSHGVPLVISTDDAGILRSNLIHQFVLMAGRYPGISYGEIKTMILNSIDYSFIREPRLKAQLRKSLERKIGEFEKAILAGAGKDQKAGCRCDDK